MAIEIGHLWNIVDDEAYIKHDFRMSSSSQAQRKLDENYNKQLYNYKRKYGEIENKDDENDHVWNGRNDRIKDKPPPPRKLTLNNMSYLEKIDDKSGAT